MRPLFLVLVFVLTRVWATAAITDYVPTRDTFMRGSNQLHGTSTNGRASKSFIDFYITDFDRAAINSFIATELGHPMTLDDMPNIKISLNLFSNDFQGYKPTARSRPAVFQGTQDWVEGTNSTFGATKEFAIYDPANPANNRPWKDLAGNDVPAAGNGGAFINVPRIENAQFEEWGGDPFTFREWVLDDNVEFAYLTDPVSLGLFLNASDAGNENDIDAQYSNTEIYSREAAEPGIRPFLRVDVIPEPGSVSMLALGALLLVRRKPVREVRNARHLSS